MKRLVLLTTVVLCTLSGAQAQSFLDRLQHSSKSSQGRITVHQSEEINRLVNATTTPSVANSNASSQPSSKQPSLQVTTPSSSKQSETATAPAKSKEPVVSSPTTPANTADAPQKKVLRKSYKVNGYRVQVFSGGNSRNDRLKAERIGNEIKSNFPDEPVYVHFYSPRWICRVGNYRTYEEAHAMLTAIKEAGHQQASIVKGKITVQY